MADINYKVVEMLEKQTLTTANGSWDVQEIVLEEIADVQYPDRYLIRFSGDNISKIEGINIGDTVTAKWSASVRNYLSKDGRKIWSQNLKGWQLEKVEDENIKAF